MFKNIIIAVDGSEYGNRALKYAKNMAERYGAALWIVHVFPHTSDLLGYEDFEMLFSRRKGAGQAILDEAKEQLGDVGFDVKEELLEGPEAEAILEVAEKHKADLIVMGTRGLGSVKGLLLGSVSHKVMHYAACPVMVVR
jgi:nucleotide-binding universal stress UspA family protein